MIRELARSAATLIPLCLSLSTARAQSASVEIALVANSQDATVVLLDVATRSIVGRIDVNPARVKASGPGAPNYAQDTDVSPDGKTLYVSRAYMGDVAAFDMVTGRLLWKTPLNTGRADHMTLTPDGRSLFVSAMLDNRIYRIAAATGEITGHVVAGVYPHDNKVQLANQHAVAFFDLAARRFTRRLELPVKPGIVASDYDFEAPHHGLALTRDGRTLRLAGRASDYAALVSAPDLKLLATIPVGDGPGWAETAANGNVCLVTNVRSDDLSIISIREWKEVLRLPIGDGPKHITIARIPESVIAAIKAQS